MEEFIKELLELLNSNMSHEFLLTVILSPFACAFFSFLIGSRNKQKKWINYKKNIISMFYIYAIMLFIFLSVLVIFIAAILSTLVFIILKYLIVIILFLIVCFLINFINSPKTITARILIYFIYSIILFDLCTEKENENILPLFSGFLILISAHISHIILICFNNILSIEDKIPKKLKQALIVVLYLIIQLSIFNTTTVLSHFFNFTYLVLTLPSLLIFMHDTNIYRSTKCQISYAGKELSDIELSKISRKGSYIEIEEDDNSKICILLDKIDIKFYGEPVKESSNSYMYIVLSKIKRKARKCFHFIKNIINKKNK